MPIYQYVCPSCNNKFEFRQSFTDVCKVSCPKCHNGARRIFIPVPVIFKGSGFYVTDSSQKSEIQDSPPSAAKETKEIKNTAETRDTKETKATKETKKEETPASKAS